MNTIRVGVVCFFIGIFLSLVLCVVEIAIWFLQEHEVAPLFLDAIATLHSAGKKYGKAQHYFGRALLIRERIFGIHSIQLLENLRNLAEALEAQGKREYAEAAHKRAIDIWQRHPNRDLSQCLLDLAEFYFRQNNSHAAQQLQKRALSLSKENYHLPCGRFADALHALAYYYYRERLYSEAAQLWERCLMIKEADDMSDPRDIANCLYWLAVVCYNLEAYEQAEPLYQRCLLIRESYLGPTHPEVIQVIRSLSVLYYRLGRVEEAEPLFARSLALEGKLPDKQAPGVQGQAVA